MSSKNSHFEERLKTKRHESKSKSYSRKNRSKSRSRSSYDSSKKREKETKRHRSRSKSREKDFFRKNDDVEKISKKSRWSDAPLLDSSEKQRDLYLENQFKLNQTTISNNENFTKDQLVTQSFNTIYNNLNESTKFKRKVYIPKQNGVNFVGLLIGPKGAYQKRLETQTNCKILIRGKGTQKDGVAPQPDDEDEQHVLIVGDAEENVIKAEFLIQRVLHSDDETRNKIKEEQLRVAQEIRTDQYLGTEHISHIDDHLMTPYGPPDKNARIIPVPNDCVGLIIGKNGETIRRLHREAGCKIQIAKAPIPNTEVRNVFIEGPNDKYENAKKLIEDIVAEQQKMKVNFSSLGTLGEQNPFSGPHTKIKVLNKYIGLIIGKNGETVRNLHHKTGCFIFIPKESREGEDFRLLELSGKEESIKECIKNIEALIENANKISDALYQSIDLNYLSKQSTQTEISNKNDIITETNKLINNFSALSVNNSNTLFNQSYHQNLSYPYAFNPYQFNNNFRRISNNQMINMSNLYHQNINIHPYLPNQLNNFNNFNIPINQTIPTVPVIQHMSINNFPATTYVNLSNNLTQNHFNIRTTANSNVIDNKEKVLDSSNINENNNLNQNKTSIPKKKDDSSKKSSSSILNYIYGGQVK